MMKTNRFYAVALVMMATIWFTKAKGEDLASVTRPGANIQRTMKLLEESTPLKRNTVRILFYGQSITEQEWWKTVAADLTERYPNADLRIENRAIGGFTAPKLIKTAEYDLYPNYPDLVFFHVYDDSFPAMAQYEEIVRRIRARTTAEILLATHHDIGNKSHYGQSARIRELAVKYRCGLVDIERSWQEMLKREKLEPKEFLNGTIHLNEKGIERYAGLVKSFFVYDPKPENESSQKEVTYIPVSDVNRIKHLDGGILEIPFEGNRIDIIPVDQVGSFPMADVLIDGRKPSDFPGTCAFTRPSTVPYGWMPVFMTITHNQPLLEEEWRLDILESSPDGQSIRLKVTGTLTGEDGEGTNKEKFVSKSGRVVIEGGDNWMLSWWLDYHGKHNSKEAQVPDGYKAFWRAKLHGMDVLRFPQSNYNGTENAVTVVQGISNGPHVLRLVPWPGIKMKVVGFRVFNPPLHETM